MNTHGITDYSEVVAGTQGNHLVKARFDVTDGFVGITQYDGDILRDRVLLSPGQWKALVAFVSQRHPRTTK